MKEYTREEADLVLADSDGHFPYKEAEAVEGHPNEYYGATATVNETEVPDPSAHVEAFVVLPQEAAAARAYIQAQQTYLESLDEADRERVDQLAKELVEVRRQVRETRAAYPGGYVSGNQFVTGRD